MKPTGDADLDALKQQRVREELARLERNADRREAREKQKGKAAASPSVAASPVQSNGDGTPHKGGRGRPKDGTQRKCAGCGEIGHIKTNRKSVKFHCVHCGGDRGVPLDVADTSSFKGKARDPNHGTTASASGAMLSSYSSFEL
jgi:hypothetical protein